MRKAICPITNKPFDCLPCIVPSLSDNGKCPYMERDELTERELKLMRKLVEREFKHENGIS